MVTYELSESYASSLDLGDPLSPFRAEFFHGDPDTIYLDGNSLGRLPLRAMDTLDQVIRDQWGDRLIHSWGEHWYRAPELIGQKIARLIGSKPGQVVVCDSTTVNLYKLVMAALEMRVGRSKIISDTFNFPSDLYVIQGCIRQYGNNHQLKLISSSDNISMNPGEVINAIDEKTALVVLSLVSFKSGFLYNAEEISLHADKMGALVIWDLSHAVGAVPIDLDSWNAPFAIGCTYKYLNGGPGSPAFLYVRKDIQPNINNPIWGWFGAQSPFTFNLEYDPAEGLNRLLCGTPPVLSLMALEPSLDIILDAGMNLIREKSIRLGDYFIYMFDHLLAPLGFELGSPRAYEKRGSHISIRHSNGYQIDRALIETQGVIPDFREPDHIRIGLVPLYTSFQDVWRAVQRIRTVVLEKIYLNYSPKRLDIT